PGHRVPGVRQSVPGRLPPGAEAPDPGVGGARIQPITGSDFWRDGAELADPEPAQTNLLIPFKPFFGFGGKMCLWQTRPTSIVGYVPVMSSSFITARVPRASFATTAVQTASS